MQLKEKAKFGGVAAMTLLATNLFAGLWSTTLYLPNTHKNSPTDNYWDPNSVGGEFTAIVSGGQNYLANYNSAATAQIDVNGTIEIGFETFCLEMNQTFEVGTPYTTTVGNLVLPGGSSVTVGTAYLYSEFAQGLLSGYNWSSGVARELSADELQDAIWYLQGEIVNGYEYNSQELYRFNANSDPFLQLLKTQFGSISAAEGSDSGNNYGVDVLELTYNGSPAQDQLVYCPTPPPPPAAVPEPATFAAGAMLLLPLGISAVRSLRKKK